LKHVYLNPEGMSCEMSNTMTLEADHGDI